MSGSDLENAVRLAVTRLAEMEFKGDALQCQECDQPGTVEGLVVCESCLDAYVEQEELALVAEASQGSG